MILKKILSLSTLSIILSNNLYGATFKINNQSEYLNVFEQTFLSKDDHRIIINCTNCGISSKSKEYYKILDNVNKDSNITFVLNGISATYNKDVFLNNMDHLFIYEEKVVEQKQEPIANTKEIKKDNNFIDIDGERVALEEIKNLLKKEKAKHKPEIDPNYEAKVINTIKKGKEITKTKNDTINQIFMGIKTKDTKDKVEEVIKDNNTTKVINEVEGNQEFIYVVATYNKKEFANKYVNTHFKDYKTSIVETKNNKYILKLHSNKDESEMLKKHVNDFYLEKKENIVIKESVIEKKEMININLVDVIAVVSSKTEEGVKKYLSKNFSSEKTNVKLTKNGFYLGYIILENNDNKLEKLNNIKKISKDAWLIKNFKN